MSLTGEQAYALSKKYADSHSGSSSNAYTFKGSVETKSKLPTENVSIGDVYDVKDTGMNYAWDGNNWDALGGIIETDHIIAEVDDKNSAKVSVSGDGVVTLSKTVNGATTNELIASESNAIVKDSTGKYQLESAMNMEVTDSSVTVNNKKTNKYVMSYDLDDEDLSIRAKYYTLSEVDDANNQQAYISLDSDGYVDISGTNKAEVTCKDGSNVSYLRLWADGDTSTLQGYSDLELYSSTGDVSVTSSKGSVSLQAKDDLNLEGKLFVNSKLAVIQSADLIINNQSELDAFVNGSTKYSTVYVQAGEYNINGGISHSKCLKFIGFNGTVTLNLNQDLCCFDSLDELKNVSIKLKVNNTKSVVRYVDSVENVSVENNLFTYTVNSSDYAVGFRAFYLCKNIKDCSVNIYVDCVWAYAYSSATMKFTCIGFSDCENLSNCTSRLEVSDKPENQYIVYRKLTNFSCAYYNCKKITNCYGSLNIYGLEDVKDYYESTTIVFYKCENISLSKANLGYGSGISDNSYKTYALIMSECKYVDNCNLNIDDFNGDSGCFSFVGAYHCSYMRNTKLYVSVGLDNSNYVHIYGMLSCEQLENVVTDIWIDDATAEQYYVGFYQCNRLVGCESNIYNDSLDSSGGSSYKLYEFGYWACRNMDYCIAYNTFDDEDDLDVLRQYGYIYGISGWYSCFNVHYCTVDMADQYDGYWGDDDTGTPVKKLSTYDAYSIPETKSDYKAAYTYNGGWNRSTEHEV